MDHPEARALLDRQFTEGLLAAAEAEALHDHLRACASCRSAYDRWVDLERGLAGEPDVTAGEVARLLARGLPPDRLLVEDVSSATARGGRSLWRPLMALAASLLLGLYFVRPWRDPDVGVRGAPSRGRSAWIRVFAGSPPTAVDGEMQADDSLQFAYTNLRESGYGYMAIAGRDAAGRVHWYYPAYQAAAESPLSVAVERGVADRELPDAVRAPLAPGPLTLCAIFTAEPLDVVIADRVLEETGEWPTAGLNDCRVIGVKGGER